MTNKLPTAQQMIEHAVSEINAALYQLDDAADWLRSDWQPVGSPLNPWQTRARTEMRKAIAEAKATIEAGKRRAEICI